MDNAVSNFIDFRDVWLAYNEELLAQNNFAVEAINLQVKQGEFIAIVGPSGCGKSTFMKLATGLKMPSVGEISIDEQPVTGPLKISGMAFQSPSLLPWRTTLDNVLLPLEIVEPYRSNFKLKRKEYEERASRLLQKVGLGGYENKFPWQLSGGMQQRANLEFALVIRTAVVDHALIRGCEFEASLVRQRASVDVPDDTGDLNRRELEYQRGWRLNTAYNPHRGLERPGRTAAGSDCGLDQVGPVRHIRERERSSL